MSKTIYNIKNGEQILFTKEDVINRLLGRCDKKVMEE